MKQLKPWSKLSYRTKLTYLEEVYKKVRSSIKRGAVITYPAICHHRGRDYKVSLPDSFTFQVEVADEVWVLCDNYWERLEGVWVLATKDRSSYFKEWTGIGPMMTNFVEEAKRFETYQEAVGTSTKHWALIPYYPQLLNEPV